MRKAQMQAVIDNLKDANAELERVRVEAMTAVHAKIDGLGKELAAARRETTALKADVARHKTAIAKQGEDLSGLADSVRASLLRLTAPGPEQDQPKPVTPIASKRGSKAAG